MIKRTTAAFAISAFGLVLGAGASLADGATIPCGTPAVPAQYGWVVTQPAVPEVSHLEYEWARQTAPAHTEWKWTRTVTTTIYTWKLWVANTETPSTQWSATSPGEGWENTGESRIVVVTPAETRVVTEYEFRKKNKNGEFTGASKWLTTPTWNAQDPNDGAEAWEPTGQTRSTEVVITPAVEVEEFLWQEVLPDGEWTYQESATSPGEGWVQDGVVSSTSTTEETWSETEPEGEGWTKTDESRTTPATYEYQWAATSPGEGWTKTDAEPKKVVDVAGVPETKEWQVVVPAVPAGPPCPVDETPEQPPVDQPPVGQPPVDQPPVEQPPVEQPPVVETPVDETPDEGPVVEKPAPVKTPAKPEAAPVAQRPASAVPQVGAATPTRLAHTGSDLTLLWTGLGFIVLGAGLSAGYRRSTREN